ncbi:NAD(P)/FAD-dependent oxidoreductase [cf. Phormidesmis sp. LEGE 11477]|uniref:dihydrolipoyl dehydrogenase family protein n=1 Tax=cf. Phormidesmis sp. LEGE 11477 TaxID=1828680 RepID=UPI00187FEDCC|nr:FAD-dependent oxidoreductase [cf. Phormidesmis sp. LEGE 11477]MBE9060422.1 FAD-dependent oxidoreductase [cf. Phormidesmis sp. LEGE 11477]
MSVEYDLVVIGGGSAGLVAASAGAQINARVALIEKHLLGGDCLHYGCVPSKSMIHAAQIAYNVKTASRFGIYTNEPKIDLQKALGHVHAVIDTIQAHDSTERFEKLGVDVIYGKGQFVDEKTFEVNGRQLKSRSFLVATGSRPSDLPVQGLKEAGYLTNEQVFNVKERPATLAVIGAGPIGCELGQSFSRLGSQVTLLASRDVIMPKEDPEAARVVQSHMEAEGVRILTNTRAKSVKVIDGKKHIFTGSETIVVDEILVAAGRSPNVESLNLEAAGVTYDKKGIKVDAKLRTSNHRIYAAGDIIGGYQFTHVAGYEAGVAMQNALVFPTKKADYRVIPWATFTEPELARVGLTERQARDRYGDDIYILKQGFDGVDRALAESAGYGFAKFITKGNGEILGAHIVGPHAGELIHEAVLAMANNLKVSALQCIHVYPTLSEISPKTALQLTKQKYAKNTFLQNSLRKFFNWRRSIAG